MTFPFPVFHPGSQFVATGGTITTDGAYTVHTFTTSGTFTVISGEKTVECLVVGGGGGGGGNGGGTGLPGGNGGTINNNGVAGLNYISATQNAGGGGGGGGCAQWASILIAASKTVTVGDPGLYTGGVGSAGGTSVFDIVSSGGGAGGQPATSPVGTGGAGGAKGTGTGGTTTMAGIAPLSTAAYGKGGQGTVDGDTHYDGYPGYVIVRYLTLG